jgi:hypothetical protein
VLWFVLLTRCYSSDHYQGSWNGWGVACIGWKIFAYGLLVVKHGARRPLDIFRHRWEDNISMDCKEIGWEGVDWIHMAGDYGNEPVGSIKCRKFVDLPRVS